MQIPSYACAKPMQEDQLGNGNGPIGNQLSRKPHIQHPLPQVTQLVIRTWILQRTK